MDARDVDAVWLQQTPFAVGVVRAGRFALVNDALVELTGLTREQLVGADFTSYVVPADRDRVRERHMRRLRGEPVPDSYEVDLIRPEGGQRRVEVHIQMMGDDALFAMYDRSFRAERSQTMLQIARLGATVQFEQSAEAVLQRVRDGLNALGCGVMLLEPSDKGIRLASIDPPTRAPAALRDQLVRGAHEAVGAWTPSAEQAWTREAVFLDDLLPGIVRFFGPSRGEQLWETFRDAEMSRGVLLRLDVDGQRWRLCVIAATWLLPEELPALALFGAQISAALTAARSIADLSQRNAELAALNRVASAAATTLQLRELFERGADELATVLACQTVVIDLLTSAGELERAHVRSSMPSMLAEPRSARLLAPPPRAPGEPAASPNVWRRSADADAGAVEASAGHRVVLSVPLLARATVVGVLRVGYVGERTLRTGDLEFLQAMAAHFAAAVESGRLVDDLRKSYGDLALTQKQLVEHERLAALGELAAAVAHEVRNPLAVIFNSLGSLRHLVPPSDDAQTLLGILSEEATRLNAIVGDMIDFARPITPSRQPLRLAEIVDEAVDAAMNQAGPDVVVDREYEPLPAVPVDGRLIRQAVLNVALNAAQSMGGRGTLRVRVRRCDGPPSVARIEIDDSGPGVTPEHLPRVFEPFFTTRAMGTGLGLAVVKRIIEGHRGRVSLVSEPGRGTRFVIELPLETETPPDGLDPRAVRK